MNNTRSVTFDNSGVGGHVFHGGHRLWVSPEIPETTHGPDDRICRVKHEADTLVVTGQRDDAGFEEEIDVRWQQNRLAVDHRLWWTGKRFSSVSVAGQSDRSAVGQIYINEHFPELESVGPAVCLEPADEIGHRETWEAVDDCVDIETVSGLF